MEDRLSDERPEPAEVEMRKRRVGRKVGCQVVAEWRSGEERKDKLQAPAVTAAVVDVIVHRELNC